MKIFLSLCILPFYFKLCVCVFGIECLLPKRLLICQAFLVILLERPKFGWIVVCLSLLTFAGSRRPKENTWNTTTLFLHPEVPNLSVFSSFFSLLVFILCILCTFDNCTKWKEQGKSIYSISQKRECNVNTYF